MWVYKIAEMSGVLGKSSLVELTTEEMNVDDPVMVRKHARGLHERRLVRHMAEKHKDYYGKPDC